MMMMMKTSFPFQMPLQMLLPLLFCLSVSSVSASIEARQLQEVQEDRCTVCPAGSPITNPTGELNVPGFGVQSCAVISGLVGTLYPLEDPNCQLLHSVSTACGCPSQATKPCQLCGDGNRVPDSKQELPLSYLDESVNYEGVNCKLLETYFNSSIEADDLTCQLSQAWTKEYCCSADEWIPPQNPSLICVQNSNATIDLGESLTCQQVQDAAETLWEESEPNCVQVQSATGPVCGCDDSGGFTGKDIPMCTLCKDASNVTTPNKLVPFMADRFFGVEPTCQQLESATGALTMDSKDCTDAQLIGSYCGCPSVENGCIFCPKPGDAITTPTRKHSNTMKRYGEDVTCEQLESVLLQFSQDSDECFLGQEHNWECGCNDGFYGYLGTESRSDILAIHWSGRISGILSVMGSLFIFQDFLRGKGKKNLYRQIMFLMSIFDFTTAMGWVIGAAPIPTTDLYGYDNKIVGASGNEDLCIAQGFFVMLGYGSGFFNISLSIYYVLVVVHGWKDHQLKKARPFLLSVPVVCAMILASGGIPFYDAIWVGCWFVPRPYTDDWSAFGFFFGPVVTTGIISTSCQIRVYLSVRATLRKGQQWSMDHRLKQRSEKDKYTFNTASNSTGQFSMATAQQGQPQEEKKSKNKYFGCNCCKDSPLLQDNAEATVFWQSAFYLFSYYSCWPILLVGVMIADSQNFAFWMAVSTLAPLQGFFNMLVYTRPRFTKWRRTKRMEKEKKRRLLEKQQKAKVAQRAAMDDAIGGTATVSQSYRNGQDSTIEEKPVSIEVTGGGIEEATSDNGTKEIGGPAVPEGSGWALAMSERTDVGDQLGYSKQFECLA